MNERIRHISDEIRQLTPAEQAELLAEIADVVAPADAAAIDEAWIEEAERRLAEIDSGQVLPVPAAAALEELRARYPRRP